MSDLTHSSALPASPKRIPTIDLQTRLDNFLYERQIATVKISINQDEVRLTGIVANEHFRVSLVRTALRHAAGRRVVTQIRIASPWDGAKGLWQQLDARLTGIFRLLRATPRSAWFALVLILMVPLTLASCGEATEKKVPVYPVTGKVTYQGEAPEGAQIVLHPQGHTLPNRAAANGTVKKDGTFTLSIYGLGEGVPPGEYIATLVWNKLVVTDGGAGAGPNVFPAKYGKPDTSPVKVTVKPEPNELPPIEVAVN